jgi:tetratricopeptide (TPR) repeat protein
MCLIKFLKSKAQEKSKVMTRNLLFLSSFFLFISNLIAQKPSNQSEIGLNGNNNKIAVYQGTTVTVYNVNSTEDVNKFIHYLHQLPKISAILDKIDRKIEKGNNTTALILKLAQKGSIFNPQEFTDILEKYVSENDHLKQLVEDLKKTNLDTAFNRLLVEAEKYLTRFDHKGYQSVMEEFEVKSKAAVKNQESNLSKVAYLRSLDDYNEFQFKSALIKINEALLYGTTDTAALYLKAMTLERLSQYDSAIEITNALLLRATSDSVQAEYLSFLGVTSVSKGDNFGAIGFITDAIKKWMLREGNELAIAGAYNVLGMASVNSSVYKDGVNYFKESHKYLLRSPQKKIDVRLFILNYENTGVAYRFLDSPEISLQYLQNALNLEIKLVGQNHPDVANCYNNISSTLIALARNQDALDTANKALNIYLKFFDSTAIEIGECYQEIGVVQMQLGNLDTAFQLFTRALKIFTDKLTAKHPRVGLINYYIGEAFQRSGLYTFAITAYLRALDIEVNSFGLIDLNVYSAYIGLGICYDQVGKCAFAKETFAKALTIAQIRNHTIFINEAKALLASEPDK